MPKSKRRRTSKRQPRLSATGKAAKSPLYKQPCSDELLVEEFGEENAGWLLAEYERPLNLADLELEKAIRDGKFRMAHPQRGTETWSLETVGKTLRMTTYFVLNTAREQGLLSDAELQEIDGLEGDLASEDAPDEVRGVHAAEGLFLNSRGLWDFGE